MASPISNHSLGFSNAEIQKIEVREGRLFIPGAGYYAISLTSGGKNVDSLITGLLIDQIVSVVKNTLANSNVSLGSLGEKVEITAQSGIRDDILLRDEKTSHGVVTDQTTKQEYKELTQMVVEMIAPSQNKPIEEVKVPSSPRLKHAYKSKKRQQKVPVDNSVLLQQQASANRVPINDVSRPLSSAVRPANVVDPKHAIWKEFAPLIKGNLEGLQSSLTGYLEKSHVNPAMMNPEHDFEEITITDLLKLPENRDLHEVITQIVSNKIPKEIQQTIINPAKVTKAAKNPVIDLKFGGYTLVKFAILKHIYRNPRRLQLDEGGSQSQQFLRGKGSLNKVIQNKEVFTPETLQTLYDPNHGWSSEIDKFPSKEMQRHCTNLGIVRGTSSDRKSEVICLRSGKTPNFDRIKELVITGCLASWSDGIDKFRVNGNRYEYQMMITSLMDYSILKKVYAGVKTHNPEEDERGNLDKIMAAIREWPLEGIEVFLPDPKGSGGLVRVLLKRPLFSQQILSGFLKFNSKVKDGLDLALEGEYGLYTLFGEKFLVGAPKDRKQIKEYLTNLIATDAEKRDLLIALYVTLYGKYPKLPAVYPTLNGGDVHSADLVIARKNVTSAIGIDEALQCKSGVDRTGEAVALLTAAHAFRQTLGRNFYPHSASPEDVREYKRLFHETLKSFAMDIPVQSKGLWGISWEMGMLANPVAYKYMPDGFLDKPYNESKGNKYDYKFKDKDMQKAILGESVTEFRKVKKIGKLTKAEKLAEADAKRKEEEVQIAFDALDEPIHMRGLNLRGTVDELTEKQIEGLYQIVKGKKGASRIVIDTAKSIIRLSKRARELKLEKQLIEIEGRETNHFPQFLSTLSDKSV